MSTESDRRFTADESKDRVAYADWARSCEASKSTPRWIRIADTATEQSHFDAFMAGVAYARSKK